MNVYLQEPSLPMQQTPTSLDASRVLANQTVLLMRVTDVSERVDAECSGTV
jgi:hypothetical protein